MADVEALSSEQRSEILAQCATMETRIDAFFAGVPIISTSHLFSNVRPTTVQRLSYYNSLK